MAAPTRPKNNNTFMARLLPGPCHYLGFNAPIFNYSSRVRFGFWRGLWRSAFPPKRDMFRVRIDTLLVGGGLMALVFYSGRAGFDEPPEVVEEKKHRAAK